MLWAWAASHLVCRIGDNDYRYFISLLAAYFICAGVLARPSGGAGPSANSSQVGIPGNAPELPPFFSCYTIPFLFGFVPNVYQEGLQSFSKPDSTELCVCVVRYKLMDVDIIFKRGLTYVLAGSLTLAGYFSW